MSQKIMKKKAVQGNTDHVILPSVTNSNWPLAELLWTLISLIIVLYCDLNYIAFA